jgi:hypothetical protein
MQHAVAEGRGLRVPEGGAEGVHVGQRAGVSLHVQLPRHGQAGAAAYNAVMTMNMSEERITDDSQQIVCR